MATGIGGSKETKKFKLTALWGTFYLLIDNCFATLTNAGANELVVLL